MSLHYLRTRAQFDAAHSMWEEPPDDPPYVECPCCSGRKSVMKLDEENKPWRDVCDVCRGAGLLDAETGEPYDRAALAKLAEGE